PGARADAEPPGARRRARLGDRAIHERVAAEPGGDGERRVHDGRDLRGPFEARGVPAELEPEGILDVGRAGTGEPGVAGHGSRIAGEAVDVGGLEPRVGDRSERRLAGEVETGAVEPAADLRLPDAGENRASLEVLLRARPLTACGLTSVAWQRGQTGRGGWTYQPQARQRAISSRPARHARQKGSVSGSRAGSGGRIGGIRLA